MILMEDIQKPQMMKKAQQPPEFLAVGRILRPHGVRGNLLISAESDVIKSITSGSKVFLGPEHIPFTVRHFSTHRNHFLLNLETLNSRDDAEVYRQSTVYIHFEDRSPLPENVYFHWQLLGLHVRSDEDENLGILSEIIETGANDVYLVRSEEGDELLLPAIESVVQAIDLEESLMIVHLIPGLRTNSN
jgi:16S rRNA processing protein RimM